jgi:hypothetical protein
MVIALGLAASAAPRARAQLLAIDSVTFAVDSRYGWRSYDRGGGATLREGIELGLAGFSRNGGSRNNLTSSAAFWQPLRDRGAGAVGDQSEASIVYGRCLFECARLPWAEKVTLDLSANGYWLAGAGAPQFTWELQTDLAGLLEIQQIGGRQLGIRLFPCLTAAHDFRRYHATYTRGCIGTQIGPMMGFAFAVDGGLAFSDYPGSNGSGRGFDYHGADAGISVNREFSVANFRTIGVRVIWHGSFAADAIGPDVGIVTLRIKWY